MEEIDQKYQMIYTKTLAELMNAVVNLTDDIESSMKIVEAIIAGNEESYLLELLELKIQSTLTKSLISPIGDTIHRARMLRVELRHGPHPIELGEEVKQLTQEIQIHTIEYKRTLKKMQEALMDQEVVNYQEFYDDLANWHLVDLQDKMLGCHGLGHTLLSL